MKLYKRDGRRFVEIQDTTGMFYQKDGTFQEKRDENSIGICVLQTCKVRKIALFERYLGSWWQCKEHCHNQGGYIPSIMDMFLLKPYAACFAFSGWFWTSDECSSDGAWGLTFYMNGYFGYCYNFNKVTSNYVLAFMDVELNLYNHEDNSLSFQCASKEIRRRLSQIDRRWQWSNDSHNHLWICVCWIPHKD